MHKSNNTMGLTLLHLAVSTNQIERARRLLAAGINPNEATAVKCETPLHRAVRLDNKDMCSLLLEAGADPELTTVEQASALYLACKFASPDVVTLLLRSGAQLAFRSYRNKRTPLHAAAYWTRYRSRPSGRSPAHAVVHVLLEAGADIDAADQDGHTALHYAVRAGDATLVKQLLAAGADPSIAGRSGTAADLADALHKNEIQNIIEICESPSLTPKIVGQRKNRHTLPIATDQRP